MHKGELPMDIQWKESAIDAACRSFSSWWDVSENTELGKSVKEQIRKDITAMLEAAARAQFLNQETR